MSAYVYAFFENHIMRYVGVTASAPQYRIMDHKYEKRFSNLFKNPNMIVRCVRTDTLWDACRIEYGQILRYRPVLNRCGVTRSYVPPIELLPLLRQAKYQFTPFDIPIRWSHATKAPMRLKDFEPIDFRDCLLLRSRLKTLQQPPKLRYAVVDCGRPDFKI